ncbi:MAG TPA: hypothetical protein VMT30_04320 [Candidatus Saccharimonadia bacterium]|nr:hypothetical protein [Candidatus Saccharimonadia bacterium]
MPTDQIKIHDFSYTLYRWAYDYHNSVNDLLDKHPGLAMFAVKYNNACLAFELIIKSHIAHKNHASTPEALDKVMRGYGHSLVRLARYAVEEIGLYLPDEDWKKLELVDKYYATHQFRYPPYEPRKSDLNHIELLAAINELRFITATMLVVAHEQTDGYAIS